MSLRPKPAAAPSSDCKKRLEEVLWAGLRDRKSTDGWLSLLNPGGINPFQWTEPPAYWGTPTPSRPESYRGTPVPGHHQTPSPAQDQGWRAALPRHLPPERDGYGNEVYRERTDSGVALRRVKLAPNEVLGGEMKFEGPPGKEYATEWSYDETGTYIRLEGSRGYERPTAFHLSTRQINRLSEAFPPLERDPDAMKLVNHMAEAIQDHAALVVHVYVLLNDWTRGDRVRKQAAMEYVMERNHVRLTETNVTMTNDGQVVLEAPIRDESEELRAWWATAPQPTNPMDQLRHVLLLDKAVVEHNTVQAQRALRNAKLAGVAYFYPAGLGSNTNDRAAVLALSNGNTVTWKRLSTGEYVINEALSSSAERAMWKDLPPRATWPPELVETMRATRWLGNFKGSMEPYDSDENSARNTKSFVFLIALAWLVFIGHVHELGAEHLRPQRTLGGRLKDAAGFISVIALPTLAFVYKIFGVLDLFIEVQRDREPFRMDPLA